MYAAALLVSIALAALAPGAHAQAAADHAPPGLANAQATDTVALAVTDDFGHRVALSAPARRVFSVLPSLTEVVAALAPDRLIARTRYDRDPRLAHLPSMGGTLRPNLEALARLKPDLVISWADPGRSSIADRIEALSIPVYRANPQTIDDIRQHLRRIGTLLGLAAEAEAQIAALDRDLAAVAEAVRGREPVDLYYSVWHDPPQTTGAGTFIDEVIAHAGGRNIFADASSEWPRVSLEAIVRRDPDVLVIARHTGESANAPWLASPGWRELRAVRAGRCLVVEGDLFNRPGPRVAEAARHLARFLHSDALPLPGAPHPASSPAPTASRPPGDPALCASRTR